MLPLLSRWRGRGPPFYALSMYWDDALGPRELLGEVEGIRVQQVFLLQGDTCFYEYRIERARLGRLLLSPAFAAILTGAVGIAGVFAAGTLRGVLLREGLRCRCTVAQTPHGCQVHRRPFMRCVMLAMYFGARLDRVIRVLQRHRALTVLPVHVFGNGIHVLTPIGVLLYLRIKTSGFAGMYKFVTLLLGTVVTIVSSDLRQEAALEGMVMTLRDIYLALQRWGRRVGQQLGERVLEAPSRSSSSVSLNV
eukprot:CAMPEP_0117578958 /NCGR_PEP_ID=MMETSP0784-20121206/64333_1 /TAXON_ID=39447 /ORGANISM="" /LENGTH=249 /DNA_ID=CAMNT_0005378761 /DNA_START=42 /DNA_END=788 /DNA_ORIENTATION=+